jgi:acyl-coenzyme A synthetase/AMP-(fatty) acid ligase
VAPGIVATGDLFRIDRDGYHYFAGRLSDFIVAHGEKVSLHAVRQFVQSLPGVVRCAVSTGVDTSGDTHFDLQVSVTEETARVEECIRREVRSFLLPAERPRTISVDYADGAIFQK